MSYAEATDDEVQKAVARIDDPGYEKGDDHSTAFYDKVNEQLQQEHTSPQNIRGEEGYDASQEEVEESIQKVEERLSPGDKIDLGFSSDD